MDYQRLLLAHGAFYRFEKRAKFYDIFMNDKKVELWNQPDLPLEEVNKLFRFLRRWDYHFRGVKKLFREVYSENFEEIMHLMDKDLYSIHLDDIRNRKIIRSIMESFSNINNEGRYEATAASKIAHVTIPDLFVMWDRKIREGSLGNANYYESEIYATSFLPCMQMELFDLVGSCGASGRDASEIIQTVEDVCGGLKITKLIDQYNYMTYTMPTEYDVYIEKIRKNAPEDVWDQDLLDSIDFWRDQFKYTDKGQTENFVDLLNKLKKSKVISAKQRREFLVTWRDGDKDQQEWVYKEVERLASMNEIT